MNKFYNNLNKNYFKKGRTFVIAEIGTNHNQRLSQAKKLIKIAKLAGADAVKFQLLNFEEQFDKNSYSSNFKKNFKKIEFNNNWLSELIEFCKKKEIIFFASPTYYKAADILIKKTQLIKIASPQTATDEFLTKKILLSNKTCILSNGLLNMNQSIKKIKNYYKINKNIILLYCISRYPTKLSDLNLNCIKILKKKLKCVIGFSDHTLSIDVPSFAVSLGAKVIEKHLTLNRNMEGPDHKFALEPKEFKDMILKIRNLELSLGKITKVLNKSDLKIIKDYKPKLFSKVDITKNNYLSDDLIYTKRTPKGIEYKKNISLFRLKNSIKANQLILKKYLKK